MFKTAKLLALTIFVICSFVKPDDSPIIPRASYAVCDGTEEYIRGLHRPYSGNVTFYSFNGTPLQKNMYYQTNYEQLIKQLDPNAQKPQLVSCKIKYYPGIDAPVIGKITVPKVDACHRIIFYDKHNNPLFSCHFLNEYMQDTQMYTMKSLPIPQLHNFNLSEHVYIDVIYQMVKTHFKNQLYSQLHALMTRTQFELFIEQYLEKAEATLKSMQWCIEHAYLTNSNDQFPESLVCKKYFDCLADYINMAFQEYLASNKSTRRMLDYANEKMLSVLIELNETNLDREFNIIEEWSNIKILVQQMNKHYYKSLKNRKKMKLFFERIVD